MVKNYPSRSCYNAPSNFQLQSQLAEEQHCRANASCLSRPQTPVAGALHEISRNYPTFTQRRQRERLRATPNMVFIWRPLYKIDLTHILPTSSSKRAQNDIFFKHFQVQIELATVLCTFCRQLSQIEARTRGNRDPTSASPWATLLIAPKKTQGFAPESV